MTHLHIAIEDNSITKQIIDILKTFTGVKTIELEEGESSMTKEEILDNFDEGLDNVKSLRDGTYDKSKLIPFEDILKQSNG